MLLHLGIAMRYNNPQKTNKNFKFDVILIASKKNSRWRLFRTQFGVTSLRWFLTLDYLFVLSDDNIFFNF